MLTKTYKTKVNNKASEYDQEISQSQTKDQPTAQQGRDTKH